MKPRNPREPTRNPSMTEHLRFHFDPICPWCYITSKWVQRLVELGEVEAEWAVFSLEIVNAEDDALRQAKGHHRSEPALRTVIAVREQEGPAAVGQFYAALGARVHEQGAPIEDGETIALALQDIGLDPGLGEKAMVDGSTLTQVEAEHRALVESTRSFGVPTIVLDGGDGPAIFGPVISEVPDDDDAVELLRHVAWLARYESFSELKRDRTIDPDLESVRRWRAEQATG
jgi:protein-disulfide isomerase-like protein with CxxC motif